MKREINFENGHFIINAIQGKKSNNIRVTFKNFEIWEYKGTTQELFTTWQNTEHKGSFFSSQIRNKFESEIVFSSEKNINNLK